MPSFGQLVIWLEDNIPLTISLSPCDGSPLPLLSIMTHVSNLARIFRRLSTYLLLSYR